MAENTDVGVFDLELVIDELIIGFIQDKLLSQRETLASRENFDVLLGIRRINFFIIKLLPNSYGYKATYFSAIPYRRYS